MTFDEFNGSFTRLIDAFSPTKPDKKAKIYFEELSQYSFMTFKQAVDRIVRENERFPSIAILLRTIDAIEPQRPDEKVPCNICDGRGGKRLGMYVFRAGCGHENKLPRGVRMHPGEGGELIELHNQKADYERMYGEETTEQMMRFEFRKQGLSYDVVFLSKEKPF